MYGLETVASMTQHGDDLTAKRGYERLFRVHKQLFVPTDQQFIKDQHGASLSRPVSEANSRTGIDTNKHVASSHDFTELIGADDSGCHRLL